MSNKSAKDYQNKLRFLLLGFNSVKNKIELEEGLIIRKGSPSELKEIYERIRLGNVENQKFFLEYEFISESNQLHSPEEAFDFMQKINIFFQIFYKGEIKINHFIRLVKLDNDKYQSMGLSSDSRVSTYFPNETNFKSKDIKLILHYWSNYNKTLLTDNKALKIAMNRFLYSTQKYNSEDCLIDLMIAFEAIYLDVSEKGELSYKLALRCSNFLKQSFDSLGLFEFLKKTYNLRSLILHGANVKSNEIKFKDKNLKLSSVNSTLTEILRLTFKRLVLEKNTLKMNEIINTIDKAIVEGK